MIYPDSKVECLKQSEVEILSEYLNEVHIPQWKAVTKEKPMTARERLLASKYKNEEKPKRKRSQITLDLLDELDS